MTVATVCRVTTAKPARLEEPMTTRANHPGLMPLLMLFVAATPAAAQAGDYPVADSLEAEIRLDRGQGAVVEAGEEVRIYYRVSADAYVAIFRVDTEGRVDLLLPQHPDAEVLARGGREYRLLLSESRRWVVDDAPGEGSFFMIASPEPLDFGAFRFDAESGWDLTGAGATVYTDPYEAIDDYVVAVLPEWDRVAYALDLEAYEVVEAGSDLRSRADSRSRAFYAPVVIAAPYPAPRYRLPPRVVRWRGYVPAPHYGPPPPRVRSCCRGAGYRRYPARPPQYGPAPRLAPRYRPAPPRYRPTARHGPPGRGRYKERPRRPHG